MTILAGKTIVLGVTGSVSAYKAAELVSRLTQAGADIDVVMTEAAQRFISPLCLRALSHRPVVTSMWETASQFSVEHVSLAEATDAVLIAPATASTIAHLAAGLADDILCATVLATRAPVIIAPAMSDGMYTNAVTQENIARLVERGFVFVGPEYGILASGKTGTGRLAAPDKIIGTLRQMLGRNGDLAGRKVVVTAGGTREAIDPVRVLTNRSSGKMGYALAEAGRDRGASVKLISCADLLEPAGVDITYVTTALEMKATVEAAVTDCDALVMAAAVADYRPETVASEKLKKSGELVLKLVLNPDIVGGLKGSFIRVGFAAESRELVVSARAKLAAKSLDLIVANDITDPESGFGVDTNRVTLIEKGGYEEALPLLTKAEVADKVWDRVVALLGRRQPGV